MISLLLFTITKWLLSNQNMITLNWLCQSNLLRLLNSLNVVEHSWKRDTYWIYWLNFDTTSTTFEKRETNCDLALPAYGQLCTRQVLRMPSTHMRDSASIALRAPLLLQKRWAWFWCIWSMIMIMIMMMFIFYISFWNFTVIYIYSIL